MIRLFEEADTVRVLMAVLNGLMLLYTVAALVFGRQSQRKVVALLSTIALHAAIRVFNFAIPTLADVPQAPLPENPELGLVFTSWILWAAESLCLQVIYALVLRIWIDALAVVEQQSRLSRYILISTFIAIGIDVLFILIVSLLMLKLAPTDADSVHEIKNGLVFPLFALIFAYVTWKLRQALVTMLRTRQISWRDVFVSPCFPSLRNNNEVNEEASLNVSDRAAKTLGKVLLISIVCTLGVAVRAAISLYTALAELGACTVYVPKSSTATSVFLWVTYFAASEIIPCVVLVTSYTSYPQKQQKRVATEAHAPLLSTSKSLNAPRP